MNLHEDKKLFIEAVKFTAQQKGIQDIYIEKDYWVTLALKTIFEDSIGKETIFKGGTALSKCFNTIERFSEDIDLVVIRNESESANKLKTKIKRITKVVGEFIPEVMIEGITHKRGMIRKTAHDYSKQFDGNFGQVRDIIIIEATWLGYFEPYFTKQVSSYIYDMMVATGQADIAKQYGLLPFDVLVLDSRRTLCEKIMSLVRFSHTNNPIEDLQNKIRHTYDINQLLKEVDIQEFFRSDDFEEMLLKVANDDVRSFKNNNDWLRKHPTEAIIFSEPEKTWEQLNDTYNNNFRHLVYGEFPTGNEILETLNTVSSRLKGISWDIKLD